jgi:hypothetical protein
LELTGFCCLASLGEAAQTLGDSSIPRPALTG